MHFAIFLLIFKTVGRGSWSNAVLSSFENFNPEKIELDHCPELLNVKRALSTDGTLACYVALMMTQMGHR